MNETATAFPREGQAGPQGPLGCGVLQLLPVTDLLSESPHPSAHPRPPCSFSLPTGRPSEVLEFGRAIRKAHDGPEGRGWAPGADQEWENTGLPSVSEKIFNYLLPLDGLCHRGNKDKIGLSPPRKW